jgi:hypothetical protein
MRAPNFSCRAGKWYVGYVLKLNSRASLVTLAKIKHSQIHFRNTMFDLLSCRKPTTLTYTSLQIHFLRFLTMPTLLALHTSTITWGSRFLMLRWWWVVHGYDWEALGRVISSISIGIWASRANTTYEGEIVDKVFVLHRAWRAWPEHTVKVLMVRIQTCEVPRELSPGPCFDGWSRGGICYGRVK